MNVPPRSRRRGRPPRRLVAAVPTGLLLVTSCTSHGGATVTVTIQVTAVNPSVAGPSAGPRTAVTAGRPSTSGAGAHSLATPPPATHVPPSASSAVVPGGFVPTRLWPGQKAPQFIELSFGGVGWHQKWQCWRDIAAKVPFRFTGFLTGVYLLSDATKDKYQGPGHGVGKSSVGWNAPGDVPVEIADLNRAYRDGDEIASHFNGHVCAGDDPSGKDWSTGSWNNELDQFLALMKNVQTNKHLPATDKLAFGPGEVIGERTPCLEGTPEALYPALTAHHMTYDSSFTRRGISRPTRSHQYKIWQLGMAEFPVHGTSHFQITMDYNFYFTQRSGHSAGVTPAQSAQDSAQVQATYQDMYDATTTGNRAPLILGNQLNEWNNSAYSRALGRFLLANCGKPDTHCVSFRDLIDRSARAAADRRHPNRMQGAAGGWAASGRLLLLAAVITGVLAMHILSAADSAGSHQPMAMTPAAAIPPAISMSMSVSMPAVDPALPVSQFTDQLSGGPGAGMSPMSCCVLFLVSAAALMLLIRSTRMGVTAATAGVRGRVAPSAVTQRGPPGPGRPRIALSILRV